MKKFYILTFLLAQNFLFAQQLEIEYSAKVRRVVDEKWKAEVIKNDPVYGKDQVEMNENPDPATYKMIVSDKESSFTYIEKINNNQDPNKPVIRQAPAGFGTMYNNLVDSVSIQNFNVYDMKYHSLDPLKKWNWKITREAKEIMGYELRKATAETETDLIEAWYAPKIAIQSGPADFWGLPGLILELTKETKDQKYVVKYQAESIKPSQKKLKLIKPSEGKQISIAEIDGIFEEANNRRNEMYRNSEGVDKD